MEWRGCGSLAKILVTTSVPVAVGDLVGPGDHSGQEAGGRKSRWEIRNKEGGKEATNISDGGTGERGYGVSGRVAVLDHLSRPHRVTPTHIKPQDVCGRRRDDSLPPSLQIFLKFFANLEANTQIMMWRTTRASLSVL